LTLNLQTLTDWMNNFIEIVAVTAHQSIPFHLAINLIFQQTIFGVREDVEAVRNEKLAILVKETFSSTFQVIRSTYGNKVELVPLLKLQCAVRLASEKLWWIVSIAMNERQIKVVSQVLVPTRCFRSVATKADARSVVVTTFAKFFWALKRNTQND